MEKSFTHKLCFRIGVDVAFPQIFKKKLPARKLGTRSAMATAMPPTRSRIARETTRVTVVTWKLEHKINLIQFNFNVSQTFQLVNISNSKLFGLFGNDD